MSVRRQPWLFAPLADGLFILSPPFIVCAAVETFSDYFTTQPVTPWLWLLLVVGIDVSHVYSTLYRTYFDRDSFLRHRSLLIVTPMLCWLAGMTLYSAGSMMFWRVLAYLAVFHFVRQQYGFLRLYSRQETAGAWSRRIDAAAIYLATLYPLLYWHTHPRTFHWFLPGDFLHWSVPALERTAFAAYVTVLAVYVTKELIAALRTGFINFPKQAVLAGTALSWYTGIVRHDGDLTFTLTNVVSHGIPYMALIWIYQRKTSASLSRWFRPSMIPAYLSVLLLLAFVEEGLWDSLVWREHSVFYGWLSFLPDLAGGNLIALAIPTLAVPQATHYVLDAFLWRVRDTTS